MTQAQQLPQLALLERITAALRTDPRIRAAFLRGAFYSGRPDIYSNLEVYLIVDPTFASAFQTQTRATLARAGRVLGVSTISVDPPHLRFLFAGPVRVDLFIVAPTSLARYAGWRVLFDEEGVLRGRTHPLSMRDTLLPEHVGALCDEFWWNVLDGVAGLKRGHLWMSLRTLDACRASLTQIMRWRRDPAHPYEHFYDLERHLTAEDQQAMAQTLAEYDLRGIAMALLAAADAFDPAAREVSSRVGADYPAELAQTVKQFFIREFWALIAPGPTISA